MTARTDHHLVGRQVVYRASHPDAEPEQGMVTSVNVEAGIVFVNYGRDSTSQATSARDLTTLSGQPVSEVLERGSGRTLRQLQASPDSFVFVIGHPSERENVLMLMAKHDIRKEVQIVTAENVYSRCVGTSLPIVVDHAAVDKLTPRTSEWLVQHMSRYNP